MIFTQRELAINADGVAVRPRFAARGDDDCPEEAGGNIAQLIHVGMVKPDNGGRITWTGAGDSRSVVIRRKAFYES